MIPQTRDKEILDFIRKMGVVNTSQIERMFFRHCKYSANVVRTRMRKLVEGGFIKSFQPDPASQKIYWLEGKRPIQTTHMLTISEVYVRIMLLGIGIMDQFDREPNWGTLRPDAFCKYVVPIPNDTRKRQCNRCFEVERWTGSNNFNQNKYETFYSSQNWRGLLNITTFPKVCIITDKKINIENTENNIQYIIIPMSLDGLTNIF